MARRRFFRAIVPPGIAQFADRWRGRSIWFSRRLPSWEAACRRAGGYDSSSILDTVALATAQVVSGQAAYERDGVVFDTIEYSFPVLATLLRAALENAGQLHVLDFGGSLGSSYRECRPFLPDAIHRLDWSVVEPPAFCERGRKQFQTTELIFFSALEELSDKRLPPNVLLISGVLQYLPDPWMSLSRLLEIGPDYVVIDRTIVNRGGESNVYVQHVPNNIYRATYPVWSLCESTLFDACSVQYDLISEYTSLAFPALEAIDSVFKGYIFKKKSAG